MQEDLTAIVLQQQLDLIRAKSAGKQSVDYIIKQARLLFVTDIPGQEMIYLRKEQEAREFVLLDPVPVDLSEFPFIAVEIGITGQTATEVAQVFLNLASAWKMIGATLEGLRLQAYADVMSCTNTNAVDAVVASLRTATEAIIASI
jgi:hypothetical protein